MPNAAPFAILRTKKIKSWSNLAKAVGHALRTSKDDRQHLAQGLNEPIRILAGSTDWEVDWKASVNKMWLPKLKQGTNHTLARELFLGASPEFFKEKSKNEISEWANANIEWLKERFGSERIKLACLHLDEQSPHLSVFIVGLKYDVNRKGEKNPRGNGWTLSDGILNLGGGKDELSKLQDEYSESMKKFSLRRGIKNSKAKHQTISEWQRQMCKPLNEPVVIPKIEKPTEQDRNDVEAYGKRMAKIAANAIFKQMKPYHQQAKAQLIELNRLRAIVERLEPIAEAFKRLLERLLGHIPRLDSIEGLNEAQTRINQLIATTMPKPQGAAPKELPAASISPAKTLPGLDKYSGPRPRW